MERKKKRLAKKKEREAFNKKRREREAKRGKRPLGWNGRCYKKRFSDVGKNGYRHYLTIGEDEGRNPGCGQHVTDYEAQLVLDRHPNLQKRLGRNGTEAVQKSREMYMKRRPRGQKRLNLTKDSWDEPWLCADSELGKCKCHGTLWYGTLNDKVSGERINDFITFRDYLTVNKKVDGWADCTTTEFGSDPHSGEAKQCWCEPKP